MTVPDCNSVTSQPSLTGHSTVERNTRFTEVLLITGDRLPSSELNLIRQCRTSGRNPPVHKGDYLESCSYSFFVSPSFLLTLSVLTTTVHDGLLIFVLYSPHPPVREGRGLGSVGLVSHLRPQMSLLLANVTRVGRTRPTALICVLTFTSLFEHVYV